MDLWQIIIIILLVAIIGLTFLVIGLVVTIRGEVSDIIGRGRGHKTGRHRNDGISGNVNGYGDSGPGPRVPVGSEEVDARPRLPRGVRPYVGPEKNEGVLVASGVRVAKGQRRS